MDSGLLSLKWNNHMSTFFDVLESIRKKGLYSDVTIACEGKYFEVHKLVLSTCSDYFQEMFERTQCKHPIVVLKDISQKDLEFLLNYMYVGEVNVLQNELSSLIKAAECLRVKGLAVPDEPPASKRSHKRPSTSDKDESSSSKRNKRAAPSEDHSSSARHEDRTAPAAPPAITESNSIGGHETNDSAFNPVTVKEENVDGVEPYVEDGLSSLVKFEQFEEECTDKDVDRGGGGGVLGSSLQPGPDYSSHSAQADHENSASQLMASTSGFGDSSKWTEEIETIDDEDDYGVGDMSGFDPGAFADPSAAKSQMDLILLASRAKAGFDDAVRKEFDERYIERAEHGWNCVFPYCTYSSHDKSKVRRHMRTHSGQRPYACSLCPYRARFKSNLVSHEAAVHNISKAAANPSQIG